MEIYNKRLCNPKYIYMISNIGRIKNALTGLILKTHIINSGYIIVSLRTIFHKAKNFFVHRLVAMAFIPNIYNKNTVNHINGNKTMNIDYNLEWMTQKENNYHAKLNSLNNAYGENHYMAVLTEDQVKLICELLEQEYSYKYILDVLGFDSSNAQYNNNYDLLSNIKRGISWKYISKNYNFPKFIVGHHAKFPESILRKLFEYIEQGKTAKEASEDILHIKYTNSTTNRNFYEFYRRISKRELYYNISRDYNF